MPDVTLQTFVSHVQEFGLAIGARVDSLDAALRARFDEVDKRLDNLEKRLDGVEKRLDRMDRRFDRLEAKIDRLIAAASLPRRPVRKRR